MTFLEALDQGAVHPFRNVVAIAPLKYLAVALSVLGHPLFLLVVVVLGHLRFVRSGQRRLGFRLLLAYLTALALGLAGLLLIPRLGPHERWTPLPELQLPFPNSFPSLHALCATAVYVTLGVFHSRLQGNRAPLIVGVSLAFVSGVGQLLIGCNYITDVVASWVGGAVLVMLFTDVAVPEPS